MSGECEKCHEHCLDCHCNEIIIETVKHIETVNHPDHYQGNSIEVIDIIEDFDIGFHLGNALKYILRAGKKGDREEDLKKAIWYIEREISKYH